MSHGASSYVVRVEFEVYDGEDSARELGRRVSDWLFAETSVIALSADVREGQLEEPDDDAV